MGPSNIQKRMISAERGRGGNSTRERFRIAGRPAKAGAWFWEVPWFCSRGGQRAGIRAAPVADAWDHAISVVCAALPRMGQLASISGTWGRKQAPHPPPPQHMREQMSFFSSLFLQELKNTTYSTTMYIMHIYMLVNALAFRGTQEWSLPWVK